MLPGREEERPIDKRVSVEDDHGVGAHHARHPVHLVGRKVGQDEDASLVIADTALILHLAERNKTNIIKNNYDAQPDNW